VSFYDTAEIVRNVRCEAKGAVRRRIDEALDKHYALRDIPPDNVLEPDFFRQVRRVDPKLAATFRNYMNSAIAYDFEFLIEEDNNASASAGFFVPLFGEGEVGAGAGGSVGKSRAGERRFKTAETFGDLVKLKCPLDFEPPRKNLLYPMTGSIGIAKIMNTFIDLSEMGGGQDDFTDKITFATTVSGGANGTLVLLPITDQFRLVKADAAIDAKRIDRHNLIVSLKFPSEDLRGKSFDSVAIGAHSKVRALENLCIARAEQREDEADTLRLYPPEIYCRRTEKESAANTDRRLLE
jgi:hypothetical protein